jgi:hypothetical protein
MDDVGSGICTSSDDGWGRPSLLACLLTFPTWEKTKESSCSSFLLSLGLAHRHHPPSVPPFLPSLRGCLPA